MNGRLSFQTRSRTSLQTFSEIRGYEGIFRTVNRSESPFLLSLWTSRRDIEESLGLTQVLGKSL